MSDDGSQSSSTVFRQGNVVTVRGLDEILATLDAESKLDGLPFMPEMVPFCGRSFRVFRRAEKTCVEGIGIRSMRNMRNVVFLENLRCDGSAHEGCQRGCLFFWREAWLEEGGGRKVEGRKESGQPQLPTTKGDLFFCQSTELAGATEDLPSGKLRNYLHDLRIGEISPQRFLYVLWLALTNRLWWLVSGRGYYQIVGDRKKTQQEELNLQPGEWVEIKSMAEVQATLDDKGRNRGLSFEPEMALHCGRRYRVATVVRKIIAEETGKMVNLSNSVILDGLVCQGICSLNCPRANYLYWREIWLKRV